ncbi:Excalibur calcium-binding domain-containing protein [Actinopolymorpha cephalotaxi]|uniref:Excalibur calcium-binding domain-containing protein n=1 Tax=Actinopolymorpha cephalotaxi TaxID=504797 RepID=A0A1I2SAZ0_9ACTN|nr:excalibur calcium-binding domain-containing protein [Actinopolymorpha cephalotaxi]NYH87103.1 hypothetical protein [Actinopolymorpha cephalotaxi]SFG48057.1 Excalibur calcium-binding domain-containing protein [Actinopolymorpha cephalotaxi]
MYKKIAAVLATFVLATLGVVGIATADTDKYDCEDFSTQQEAQTVLEQDRSDPYGLDRDNDGIACETLPSGGSNSGHSSKDNGNDNSRDNSDDADDNGGIRMPSLIHTGGGATA